MFHQQRSLVCFNHKQINSINTPDPYTCYTTEIAPVIHQPLVKLPLLVILPVCPVYGLHLSLACLVGILKHCPIYFYYCSCPTAHDTITGQKWLCTYVLGTLSTLPRAVTIQTNQVMAGYCPDGNPSFRLFETINNLSNNVMFVDWTE